MTKLVDLFEIIMVGEKNGVLVTQENILATDAVLAQTKELEQWYTVTSILTPPFLKKGYSMLILTEKESNY